MTLTLDEVDRLLQTWAERLARIDDNLLALEADSTYQLISGAGGPARLEGLTRDRLAPALDAVGELFALRQQLGEMLQAARNLRGEVSFWNKDEVLAELHRLLCGASIDLGERPVPLSARSLLQTEAGVHEMAVPEQLLEPMGERYRQARDAIAALGRAWAQLESELSGLDGERAALRQRLSALGASNEAVSGLEARLLEVEGEVAAVSVRVGRDPLGLAGQLPQLVARLHEVATQLGSLERQQELARAGLQKARARLEELVQQGRLARAALDEARAMVVIPPGATPAVVEWALIEALRPWLEKLEATSAAGRSAAALIGLTRLHETLDAYLATTGTARRVADRLLARRTELLGRLSARRAQVRALAERGEVQEPGLELLGARAQELLARHPTPLDEAETALAELEAAALRRRSGPVR